MKYAQFPRLVNLLLVLGSIFATLLAIEIGLRVLAHFENRGLLAGGALSRGVEIPDGEQAELGHIIRFSRNPNIVYELKPDLSVLYQGSSVATNGDGFRTHSGAGAAAQDATCIVGIGDSFMFGQGVAGTDTYMAVLEDRLRTHRPGRGFEVVNTAVPGYNTVMEVATLKAKGLACDPSVIIIDFVGNDLSLPNFVLEPKRPWSLRRSFLNDFVQSRLGGYDDWSLFRRLLDAGLRGIPQDDPTGMGNTTDPALVPPAYRGLVGWDAYAAAMQELQGLSELHGFDVVSISLGPGDAPLKTRAVELSRRLGFSVVDIGAVFVDYLETNGFANYLESTLALSPSDGHPSVLAHRIAGNVLADFLHEEILPASAEPGLRPGQ